MLIVGRKLHGECILMDMVRIGLNITSGNYGRMKSLPVMFILKLYEVLSVSRLMLLIQLT